MPWHEQGPEALTNEDIKGYLFYKTGGGSQQEYVP